MIEKYFVLPEVLRCLRFLRGCGQTLLSKVQQFVSLSEVHLWITTYLQHLFHLVPDHLKAVIPADELAENICLR